MQDLLLLPKGAEGIIRLTDKQRLPMTALIRSIAKELIRTIQKLCSPGTVNTIP